MSATVPTREHSASRPYYVSPSLDDQFFADSLNPAGRASGSKANAGSSLYGLPDASRNTGRYGVVDDLLDYDDYDSPRSSTALLLRSFISTSLLGFASTALVQPFEVGKTLLQVQWIPTEDVSAVFGEDAESEYGGLENSREFGQADDDELLDEAEAEAYFSDALARPTQTFQPPSNVPRPQDSSGYLVRRSIYDESTKPEYTLPVVVTGGVWDMVRAIGRWKGEGWLSLWKGQLTTFLIDSLGTLVQPVILSLLTSAFAPAQSLPSLPLVHSPQPIAPLLIHTASHLLTGLIFSPLELVRTRLIVQSIQPRHRKYTGPIQGVRRIAQEEGGFASLYFNSNLLLPAILDHSIRPFLHLAAPLIIERFFLVSPSDNILLYGLAEFVLSTTSLLVTLPIETVRRRLQLQSRAPVTTVTSNTVRSHRAFRACVETRPAPYAGMVEAVYRILTEETGSMPLSLSRRAKRKEEKLKKKRESAASDDTAVDPAEEERLAAANAKQGNGVRQLFRGLGMGAAAQVIVFLLSLVGGRDLNAGTGWAEM